MRARVFLIVVVWAFGPVLVSAGLGHASVLTKTFGFSATDFLPGITPSPPPPQTTVTGTVTLTFDPGASGIPDDAHPDSILLSIAGQTYSVDEVSFRYFGPENIQKTFQIGVPDIGTLVLGTNDFVLDLTYDVVADTGNAGSFFYVTPATSVYFSASTTVRVVPAPEPASVLLIAGGIVGLLGIAWCRKPARV
jgi:hypothetical protein